MADSRRLEDMEVKDYRQHVCSMRASGSESMGRLDGWGNGRRSRHGQVPACCWTKVPVDGRKIVSSAHNSMLDNAGELANDAKQKLNLRTMESGQAYDYTSEVVKF